MEPTFRRSVEEHRRAVRALLAGLPAVLGTEAVGLADALGRTLATDLRAPGDLPAFDNSQMDGYAVRAADLGAGRPLPVAEPIPAGAAAPALAPGTAAPIMTGAALPAGADAVVPIEQAEPSEFPAFVGGGAPYDAGTTVRLPVRTEPGTFVRHAGSDIPSGALALAAGTLLGPAQLGLAAALGVPLLGVRARPRALVLSTGDELAAPGRPLGPGQVHDANSTLLGASLRAAGWDVRSAGIASDSVPGFTSALRRELASTEHHLVLTSGGISRGAYEVVRLALAAHGICFGGVAMQPGGPQGIGTLRLDGAPPVPLLAFPGNPVSGFVSFEMFLRPALEDLLGLAPRRRIRAPLAEELRSPPGKFQVRRAVYDGGTVRTVGGPGSHLVHALAAANALALVPEEAAGLPAGTAVELLLLEPDAVPAPVPRREREETHHKPLDR